MNHTFSASWLNNGPTDQPAPRVAVAFDRDGTANVFVDGTTGHPVHLTIASGTEPVEASTSNVEDAEVLTTRPFSAAVAATEKSSPCEAAAPLVVLSYLSLAVLAAVGATAAAIGVRTIVQF